MPAIGQHVSKLSGYAPALPTPFSDDGNIDVAAFEQFCDRQVQEGATDRSMQAYENGLKPNDTRLVLNPDSNFFRYFNDPSGKPVSPVPPDAAPTAK